MALLLVPAIVFGHDVGAVVKNNLVYVNDFNAGLFVLKLEPRKQVVP